jgi:hypothetical protein
MHLIVLEGYINSWHLRARWHYLATKSNERVVRFVPQLVHNANMHWHSNLSNSQIFRKIEMASGKFSSKRCASQHCWNDRPNQSTLPDSLARIETISYHRSVTVTPRHNIYISVHPSITMSRQNGSVLSDEMSAGDDSSYGPTPPPPKHRHPKDIMQIASVESYEVEQDDYNAASYDDDDQGTYDQSDVEKADPPAETTQEDDGDEDIDFDEEQSVEIPPTTVVQKMLMRESAPKEGSGRFALYAGIVACGLLIIVIVLSAGYGSGAFKDETQRSSVDNGDGGTTNNGGTTGGDTTGGDTTGGSDVTPASSPTMAPTEAPTEAPISQEVLGRAAAMSQYLASVNVGGLESLTDGVERLALSWLTFDDPLQLDPAVETDQQRISQRYALLNIWYNSANGWDNETGWLTVEDECAGWFGVTCDDSQVVTSISMEGNNVQGILPPDLSLLTGLVILNLAGNVMIGELPTSVATLPVLEELYLGGNFFVQDLSNYDFSGLQSLTVLELGDNGFSGTIPESIWTLSTLQFLIIDDNEFSGELSGSISQLSNLRKYPLWLKNKTVFEFFRLCSQFLILFLSCSHLQSVSRLATTISAELFLPL